MRWGVLCNDDWLFYRHTIGYIRHGRLTLGWCATRSIYLSPCFLDEISISNFVSSSLPCVLFVRAVRAVPAVRQALCQALYRLALHLQYRTSGISVTNVAFRRCSICGQYYSAICLSQWWCLFSTEAPKPRTSKHHKNQFQVEKLCRGAW